MRLRITLGACVLLSACAATYNAPLTPILPSSTPSTSSLPTRLSAKTAVVILRATGGPEVQGTRILNVSTDDAPNGIASQWQVAVGSINTNELLTFKVATSGIVGKPVREPYNPVFDDRAPPFLEGTWTLDSTDAARTLVDPGVAHRFFLEADDSGVLAWTIVTESGERAVVQAGKATLETPPPSKPKRAR